VQLDEQVAGESVHGTGTLASSDTVFERLERGARHSASVRGCDKVSFR
jgi:hypothetical protein